MGLSPNHGLVPKGPPQASLFWWRVRVTAPKIGFDRGQPAELNHGRHAHRESGSGRSE